MNASLVGFLCSGALGGLRVGRPVDEIRAMLDAPAAVARQPGESWAIWRYGDVELTIAHGRLASIHLDLEGHRKLAAGGVRIVDLDRFVPMRIDEFASFLAAHALSWRVYPPLTFAGAQSAFIVNESGVLVGFDAEDVLAALQHPVAPDLG